MHVHFNSSMFPLLHVLSRPHNDLHASKTILRGVLTDGQRWIFTIVKCKPDGGVIYRRSPQLTIDLDHTIGEPSTVRSPGIVDIIVAILANSVRKFTP
jgi:hypothetical protein